MTIENPPVLEHGFVEGRFVVAEADTLSDDDRNPDWVPMTGFLRCVPLQEIHLMSGVIPTTVGKRPVRVNLNPQGYVVDAESENDPSLQPGVKLPVGRYRVEFSLDMAAMSSYTIEVKPEHTKDSPLNLTDAAPLVVPPGFTEVVRIVDRVRAEDAAEAAEGHTALALVYRDEAQVSAQSAESDAGDAAQSATTAESHADRAETARDETLAQATEVDTSAGVAVSIGGHLVSYESGARNMPIDYGNGWLPGGSATIVRSGNIVYLNFTVSGYDPEQDESSGSYSTIFTLPEGFRPPATILKSGETFRNATVRVFGGGNGSVQIQDPSTSNDFAELMFVTQNALPTTLPGTPA